MKFFIQTFTGRNNARFATPDQTGNAMIANANLQQQTNLQFHLGKRINLEQTESKIPVTGIDYFLQLLPVFRRHGTALGNRPMEVAATLGAKPLDAFFSVVIPLARPGFLTAMVLTFAHTIGEFGVVLMIGGNIPGKTQVVSTEIYTFVEAMEYDNAHVLAGGMLVFSFLVLLFVTLFNRRAKAGNISATPV